MSSLDNARIAVVGATGLVGDVFLSILAERGVSADKLSLFASKRSAGKTLDYAGGQLLVRALDHGAFEGIDIALFSAGSDTSKTWAPIAAKEGATVIDNSSAWRMHDDVPLCVPEVNAGALAERPRNIIANPNCSTIQLAVVLAPLHRAFGIERVIVSTYQAVSGAGRLAVNCFNEQLKSENPQSGALGDVLAGNLLAHWTLDTDTGYQEEELKLIRETKKILGEDAIAVSATTVRVPVAHNAHSESVTIDFKQAVSPAQVNECLGVAPGLTLTPDNSAPQPRHVAGNDDVFVGRVRADLGNPGGIQLFCVADNLRKGAALNAIQIAEVLNV